MWFMVILLTCQLANVPSCWHENWQIQMRDANFHAFPHHVHQTHAVHVIGKRSQAVISIFDSSVRWLHFW